MLVHERELQQKYYQANQLWTGAIFNQIMFKMLNVKCAIAKNATNCDANV